MSKIIKVIILLLLIAVVVFVAITKLKAKEQRNASAPQAKIYPIVVDTLTPKESDVKLTLPYLAEVQNDKDVKLSSRIAARILYIKPSGASVKKGELLVKLDTTDIQSALASLQEELTSAKITLENLEATHKRTLELLKVHGASIEESQKEISLIAKARATIVTLQQKAIELKNNLSYATITSPVDGVVAKTFSNQGALSAPGRPLLAISSSNGFYLLVRVPTDLPLVSVDFEGREYSATALGSTFHGLAEYKVYVGDTKLISGDRVEVSVVTFHQKAALLPFDAILNRDNKSYVLVVNGKKAKAKEVHIIQSAQEGVVVSEDLKGKELVIAKPDILLRLLSGYTLEVKE
jgi:multidrug efflux pump subunit AcrA (membrane-fusion protein)